MLLLQATRRLEQGGDMYTVIGAVIGAAITGGCTVIAAVITARRGGSGEDAP